MIVFPAPSPPIVSGLVIDGRPFAPSVSLLTAVKVYVPAARRIRLLSPLLFDVLMEAIKQATSPDAQMNSAALAGRASPRATNPVTTSHITRPPRLHIPRPSTDLVQSSPETADDPDFFSVVLRAQCGELLKGRRCNPCAPTIGGMQQVQMRRRRPATKQHGAARSRSDRAARTTQSRWCCRIFGMTSPSTVGAGATSRMSRTVGATSMLCSTSTLRPCLRLGPAA